MYKNVTVKKQFTIGKALIPIVNSSCFLKSPKE